MIRIVTQILLGLMLLFGFFTIMPRMLIHFKSKNTLRAFYFLFLSLISAIFSFMSFYYAYLEIFTY